MGYGVAHNVTINVPISAMIHAHSTVKKFEFLVICLDTKCVDIVKYTLL